MTTVLTTCLRYLLILALGLNGITVAHAAVEAALPADPPSASARRQAAVTPPVPHASAGTASLAQGVHCHAPMAGDSAASATAAADASGKLHSCCKGGICACTCAAPAVLAAVFVATPVPLEHERAVTLIDYRPSHLLPLPFRPPIA